MKKKMFTALIMLLTLLTVGCSGPAKEDIDPAPPITGGKVDRTDHEAPKEIKSKDLTYFSDKFFLYGRYNHEKDALYDFEVIKQDDGSVSIEEKRCYKVKCKTDEHILKDLQAVIDKYELAKLNGVDKHTAGLPPEYQPSYFRAEYESGESLSFSTDNDPEDPCSREILKLLGDEFAAQGENCFLSFLPDSEVTRFDLEFTDGAIQYRFGELQMPREGVEKSFDDLLMQGYEDGEYYVVIEKETWNRSADEEPESVYRELTPAYYEGLKDILNKVRIIDFVNDKQYPSDFDYEKTPDYYNFYIRYAEGKNYFGFSDDEEMNREFAPAAEAIAEYIEEYINAE